MACRELLASITLFVSSGAALGQPCGGTLEGISSTGLTFNGSAFFNGEVSELVLTPNSSGQAGSSFARDFRPMVADGFATTFTFRIDGGAGDGFAFVIQDSIDGVFALGSGGSGLGYGDDGGPGIARSIAFEFDTFSFGPPFEFESQHVSIQTRCADGNSNLDSASIAHAVLGPTVNIADGRSMRARFDMRTAPSPSSSTA